MKREGNTAYTKQGFMRHVVPSNEALACPVAGSVMYGVELNSAAEADTVFMVFRLDFWGIALAGHSVLFGHPFRIYPDTF